MKNFNQALQALSTGSQIPEVAQAIIKEYGKITKIWVHTADAIAASPSPLTTAIELELELRKAGFDPRELNNRAGAVARHLQAKGLAIFWHRAGKAGPGAVASFHSTPCPHELKKQEQAEKAAAMAAKKAELIALEAAAKEAENVGQFEKQAAAMQVAATIRQSVEQADKENKAERQAQAEKAQAEALADWVEVGIQLLIQGKIDQHTWDAMQDSALARMLAAQDAKIAA